MPTIKRPPSKPRSPLKEPNAKLARENKQLRRERDERAEQQVATSEILRMIARSPGDLQAVMDAIAESAARLCEADDALVRRLDGDRYYAVSHYGSIPIVSGIGVETLCDRSTPAGRAVIDRKTIHVPDLRAAANEYPGARTRGLTVGVRTALAAPLLLNDRAMGSIHIRRLKVSPFSERQIQLLETFADQAVIAIENARLFQEREAGSRDLAALHDVTAAASRSLEIKPVLDEVVKKITEIFAFDSVSVFLFDPKKEALTLMAAAGKYQMQALPRAFRRGQGLTGRVAETGHHLIFEDVRSDPQYRQLTQNNAMEQMGACFIAIFPIKSKERFLGTINCIGKEPRRLSAEEVRLITSMCDQIGGAIDNINLFEEVSDKSVELESSNSELREALEQQTATSEILCVIASSPTDIQPVLDAVARSAAQLCDSYDATIHRVDGDHMQRVAHFGPVPVAEGSGSRPISRGFPMGRAIVDAQTIHVHDVLAEIENEFPDARNMQQQTGVRTIIATPLLRDGVAIGVINVRRTEVGSFTNKQIALLKTFADQAVIAIENVRLFRELGERNAELREALEHQTATAEVLGIISRSPTDVQPVLDAIVESAARVCGIDDVVLRFRDGDMMIVRAHFGPISIAAGREEIGIDRPQIHWISDHGTLHVPDITHKTNFQCWVTTVAFELSWSFLFANVGKSWECWPRVASRCVPSPRRRSNY